MSAKITGFKIDWRGDKVMADVQAAIEAGLEESAQDVLDASNDIVPVDTGELRNSGEVVTESNSKGKDSTSVAYSAEHAVAVHETPKNYQNGRKYKYLETALEDYAQQFAKTMEQKIGKKLR